jgi:hypothetical protein
LLEACVIIHYLEVGMGRFLGVLIAAVFISCGSGGGGQPSAASDDGGIRTLAVVDSIGIMMGDSNYVLGAIEGVAHDFDGNILVLDRSAACIKVYDPSGVFSEQIGRRGSAPGEMENPISFAVLGDGRICVIDPWRGGFLTYNPDHSFQGLSVRMTSNTPALCTGLNDSGFVAGQVGYVNEGGSITAFVRMLRYDLRPEPSHVYMENSFVIDFMDLSTTLEKSLFWGSFTGDRDGNVFFALMEPDEYEIVGIREDGTQFMTAAHEIEEVPKTEQEKIDEEVWVLAKLRGWDANWGVEDYTPQPYRNQVRQLGVDGEGRLWALRGTREDPTFDVFDSQSGEYLFTAQLPGVGYQGLFWNVRVDQGGILAYSENPSDYPKIYVIELQD